MDGTTKILAEHRASPRLGLLAGLAEDTSAAVFGASGTGKTSLAIELVADRVLQRGYDPAELLVLSASRKTAASMRDALARRLQITTRGPLARTANSVAFQIVRAFTQRPVTLLNGAEHDQLIAELLSSNNTSTEDTESGISSDFRSHIQWPFPAEVLALRGFRSDLRELLMRAVQIGLDGDSLTQLGKSVDRPEWVAAGKFLAQYEEVKAQLRPNQYDVAELSSFAKSIIARSINNQAASNALGELARLRLIVIDDAQEATEMVTGLLSAFARRGVTVVALGDPDIASNGFRGGKPELLGNLANVLGTRVERFNLAERYRGRPELNQVLSLATAHIGTALGGAHRSALNVESTADDGDTLEQVLGVQALSPANETRAIAAILRERHLLDGVPWSKMAVVLRSGRSIPALENGLAVADVPTVGAVSRTALSDSPASAALLLAASVALGRERVTASVAVDLLTGPLGGIDRIGLRRLRLALRHEELAGGGNRSADELLVAAFDIAGEHEVATRFAAIDSAPARRAGRLIRALETAQKIANDGGTIEDILWSIWQASGLQSDWSAQALGTGVLASEANRSLDLVLALFTAAERYVERRPYSPPGGFIDEQLANDLPEDTLAQQRNIEAVFVGTPASLVGQEFDVVVLARLQEGVWPNLRPRGVLLSPDLLSRAVGSLGKPSQDSSDFTSAIDANRAVKDDELRLFVLAASKAKRQLILTCTANDNEQPSILMEFAAKRVPPAQQQPMQLRSLVGLLRREVVDNASTEAAAALALLAEVGVSGAHPDEWYGIRALSTERPLVDIKNDPGARIVVSPSQISRVEESPLGWFIDRVGAPPSGIAALIGTIVHAVIEEAARTSGSVGIEDLWAGVTKRLSALPVESGWVAERERLGARKLVEGAADYLCHFVDDSKTVLQAEGKFSIELGKIIVRGTIDRVEASPDGTTVVVDLKTGRSLPTIAETADHPQLAAYQLAARRRAVPGEGRLGGAKLVYLGKPTKETSYTERAQQPFDDDSEQNFLNRIAEVAEKVSAANFAAPTELDYSSPYNKWHYRVQLVPAVSA